MRKIKTANTKKQNMKHGDAKQKPKKSKTENTMK